MKIRSFIYLTVFLIIGFIMFKYGDGKDIMPPASIDKDTVMADFADLKDNEVPAGKVGGTYYTTQIAFPEDYMGDQGDEFYVSMEDGHVTLTQRYIIEEVGATKEKSGKLVYKVKASWDNFVPPAGKYETYKNDGKSWTKIPAK